MITITCDTSAVQASLQRLAGSMANPRPVLKRIGEALVHSTKQRFVSGTAPDGSAWAPNKPSTLAAWLRERGKKPKTAKARAKVMGSKKPLIGASKNLSGGIHYAVEGNSVKIGSAEKYAATQQFGAAKGAFGKTRRGASIPWGEIKARPFLGLSRADEEEIPRLVANWLTPR